jgi:hypothetical protein
MMKDAAGDNTSKTAFDQARRRAGQSACGPLGGEGHQLGEIEHQMPAAGQLRSDMSGKPPSQASTGFMGLR